MSSVAGLVAGFLVVGSAVALFRFGKRKADELRRAIDDFAGSGPDASVIDFERDPQTGVFRTKS